MPSGKSLDVSHFLRRCVNKRIPKNFARSTGVADGACERESYWKRKARELQAAPHEAKKLVPPSPPPPQKQAISSFTEPHWRRRLRLQQHTPVAMSPRLLQELKEKPVFETYPQRKLRLLSLAAQPKGKSRNQPVPTEAHWRRRLRQKPPMISYAVAKVSTSPWETYPKRRELSRCSWLKMTQIFEQFSFLQNCGF